MAIIKNAWGTYTTDIRTQECSCEKITGPHRHRIQKTFDTHRAAVAYEKDVESQVEKREFVKPSLKTVNEVSGEWYEKKASSPYRRSTLKAWKNHIDHFIQLELGACKLADLDVLAIEKAATAWAKRTSPKTANKILTTLAAILSLAKRYKLTKDNPADDAERLKVATEVEGEHEVMPDEVYTKAELRQLIEATEPGSLERVFVMVSALTGPRIGEVLGATWPAINFKTNKLSIFLKLADTDKGEPSRLEPPKSKSSFRTIPLPPELVHELKVWKLRCPKSDMDLVFATEEGKPYHRKAASKILDGVIEKAGVKRLTPHGLRHTFASLLLSDRVPDTEVAYLMGHKDTITTRRIYAHFVRTESKAVENLAASILGGVGK